MITILIGIELASLAVNPIKDGHKVGHKAGDVAPKNGVVAHHHVRAGNVCLIRLGNS